MTDLPALPTPNAGVDTAAIPTITFALTTGPPPGRSSRAPTSSPPSRRSPLRTARCLPRFGGITDESLYSAILEGLSQLAKARDAQATPPNHGAITTLEITEAMAADLGDGAIDGIDATRTPPVRVLLGATGVPLVRSGVSLGSDLADGIAGAASAPPLMALSSQDVATIVNAIRNASLLSGSIGAGGTFTTTSTAPTIVTVTSAFGGSPAQIRSRAGDAVRITGTNFDATVAVFLGTVAAQVVGVEATSVTVTAAADTPGLKDVTVRKGADAAARLEAIRRVGPATGTVNLNPASLGVSVPASPISYGATGLVDVNQRPVLDGETFAVSLSFTPAAGASATAAGPTITASTATTSGAAIAFNVDPGNRPGSLTVAVAATFGTAGGRAFVTIAPTTVARTVTIRPNGAVQLVADGTSRARPATRTTTPSPRPASPSR